MLENLQYKVKPKLLRVIIPKAFLLIMLGILLYIGIWINFYLIPKEMPTFINIVLIIFVILLLIMDFILSYIHYSVYEYRFYDQHIELDFGRKEGESIEYSKIKNIDYKRNLWDNIFDTGNLVLNIKDEYGYKTNINVPFIEHSKNYYMYLKKVIDLNRTEKI